MRSDPGLQSELVRSLQTPGAFPHPVGDMRHLETHISHVVLAGDYAYKIKKPVDLGFLDFSSLQKRAFYCREELRLNGRLAPDIYLQVVSINGTRTRPVIDGPGETIEYAVKMRRFPQSALLNRFPLRATQVDRIARKVAAFHAGIPRVEESRPWGTPEAVLAPVSENFRQIRAAIGDHADLARLERIEQWSRMRFQGLRPVMERRRRAGFVRECHGDMHLGNMALVDDEIVIFDGIEFNPALRWIDVMSEVAFLAMDLEHTGQATLAWRFLNAYLALSGDYDGLVLLRFYQVYRAMVRAKVEAIRLGQAGLSSRERQAILDDFFVHIGLAEGFLSASPGGILITRGVSGTGKSRLTQPLSERLPGIRIRSDVERKRLFGLSPEVRTDAETDEGIYQPEATEATYARLLAVTETINQAGLTAVVDATFLKRRQRTMFLDLARDKGVPFLLLALDAPVSVLRDRVARRRARGQDASEADVAVLEAQLAGEEPLSDDEKNFSLQLNFLQRRPIHRVLERWRRSMRESLPRGPSGH